MSGTAFTELAVLTQPTPVDPHYMLLPVEQGFNWDECFQMVEAGQWYLVVFRSKHLPGVDEALLSALDNAASSSARGLPGFLHYFIGTPLHSGECLSFCLWNSRAEAALASAQPPTGTPLPEDSPLMNTMHWSVTRYSSRAELCRLCGCRKVRFLRSERPFEN